MHKTPTQATARKGFTLMEVMMAASVLTFIFLSSLAAIQQGFTMIDTARKTTLAGQILQSSIEDLRLRNWQNIPLGQSDLTTTAGVGLTETERAELLKQFPTQTCTVTEVPGYTTLDKDGNTIVTLKRVVITIGWTDFNNRTHSRSYETLFGRNGLSDYFVASHKPN